jgi:rubrerythrin
LFKLSEEKAASTLVSLCEEMGPDKISTAGKVLFFGSRILKTPEGQRGLVPIKDMIKGTYRDITVAETMVESSQQAMAEAAYRSTVLAAGKNQKGLTVGWQVLGLDKEAATRIFELASKEGFVSERETMYGMQTMKYDKKGNRLDAEVKPGTKPDDPDGFIDSHDEDDAPTSNVYTCENCGYTLFIAKGREFKFYGDDFACPECGAKKDKFKPANIEED